ncbi:MAG: hypothetical protein M3N35_07535 [Candidatus Binatota bacterium]|nr:hypothetical protein [Candidatus Binatota bacterium]
MKNWIRKPLVWSGVLQVPLFIFTVMGGGFVGLLSVGVQAYLLFPSLIALFLVALTRYLASSNEVFSPIGLGKDERSANLSGIPLAIALAGHGQFR